MKQASPAHAPAAEHLITEALRHLSSASTCLRVGDDELTTAAASNSATSLQWVSRTPLALLSEPWQQRYAIAIAVVPAELAPSQALHLLSSLRDLHARQVLAFVPTDALGWQAADLLALGMQRHARFHHGAQLIEAWSFDIKTYKAVPDWLNPRFWANPEHWGKFRW